MAKTASKAQTERTNDPEKQARIVRGFVRDFDRNLPPDAAGGMYGGQASDRFARRSYGVDDGTYQVEGSDWAVTFCDKKFVGAIRSEHKKSFPKKGVTVIAADA